MARYSKSASKDVKGSMERRKAGTLKSGKSGKTVKSKKQAIAIRCRARAFVGAAHTHVAKIRWHAWIDMRQAARAAHE
jgi:hypothetical protein